MHEPLAQILRHFQLFLLSVLYLPYHLLLLLLPWVQPNMDHSEVHNYHKEACKKEPIPGRMCIYRNQYPKWDCKCFPGLHHNSYFHSILTGVKRRYLISLSKNVTNDHIHQWIASLNRVRQAFLSWAQSVPMYSSLQMHFGCCKSSATHESVPTGEQGW